MSIKILKKRFIISSLLTIPVLLLSPTLQGLLGFNFSFRGRDYVLWVISSFIFFYGGQPFLKGLWREVKKKKPGMMTLIGVAISVAFTYTTAVVFGLKGKLFFWEIVTLIDIMLVGHWIEMRSVMGASKALESLAKLIPSKAHLTKQDKSIEDVPVSELKINDIVLVKPGEKIPSDGLIVKGETRINESMVTGESKLISKKEEDKVIGGSINGEGSINIKITHTGKDSYLSQVISLVKKAKKSKSKTQDLTNKAAFWLTIIAISIGFITLLTWLYLGENVAFSLERMVTVMVITCPHALGLAVPLVVAISTSISAKNGLLIRNRIAFEKARNIDVAVFDKTGTLTKGEFEVTDIISKKGYKKENILQYAASLEIKSEHLIARGIMKKSKEGNVTTKPIKKFKSLPGKGVEGIIDQKLIKVMGRNYLKDKNIQIKDKNIKELIGEGKTIVFVLFKDQIIGLIALADIIKEESKEAINKLKLMGIKSVILTGDNKQVAKWVAEKLGLDDFFAEILPHQKSDIIKKFQNQGLNVAMIGDGVNDAPALVQADIGIAIGAGTDVAVESADIILVRNDPRDIVSIIKLAKATYSKIKQNLIWATGYNVFAIPLAAGVFYSFGILLSPAVGAVLMSLSTIIVAINAKLLSIKN